MLLNAPTWASLLEGIKVLNLGLDGRFVVAMHWYPVSKIVSSLLPLNGPSKVEFWPFILMECGILISCSSVFSVAEVEAISQIPIGSLGVEDFMVCRWMKNGEFSVSGFAQAPRFLGSNSSPRCHLPPLIMLAQWTKHSLIT